MLSVLRALLVAAVTTGLHSHIWGAFPTLRLKPVCVGQIHSPTTITSAPADTDRLFICDQPGKIHIFEGVMLLPTPFLDLTSVAVSQTTGYSERGLLGLAFHPDYATPGAPGFGKFYVNYNRNYVSQTDPAPPQTGDPVNCVTVISEFQVSSGDRNVALQGSERQVLIFTQPQANHKGGQLEFGPDGFLYIGVGDGGGSNDNQPGHTNGSTSPFPTSNLGNSQDTSRYLGKILRINPLDPDGPGPLSYSIPVDNPFAGSATPGVKKEIYALGLRNPWRFSFDKRPGGTHRLFCGDVGQGRIEEINLIVSGGNYGWRYQEGFEFPSFSSGALSSPMPAPEGTLCPPIAMYAHPGVLTSPALPQLGLSVTGGFVYRGSGVPELQGKYVFGDYGSTSGASDGRLMGLEETTPGVFTLTAALPLEGSSNPIVGQRILCLGEDARGELYVGMKTNAGVLQLDGNRPSGGIYQLIPQQSFTRSFSPAKDNSIYSEDESLGSATSDALGYLYAGRTGSNFGPYNRRALLSFDTASQIPSGALIQNTRLQLPIAKMGPGAHGTAATLHRITEAWGEGSSRNTSNVGSGAPATTGDATWHKRMYPSTDWTTLGGSFSTNFSATATVGGSPLVFESNPAMVADVQAWINTPSSNHGWILHGDEIALNTACQFNSRQKGLPAPSLEVTYSMSPPPTRFEAWLTGGFPSRLPGEYIDLQADTDGDGVVNLLEYAFGLNPSVFDATSEFSAIRSSSGVTGASLVISFRRDPGAIDLTYRLESSEDLITWTEVASSADGSAVAGSASMSETPITLQPLIMRVSAALSLPASGGRVFVRLRVERKTH
jgi:glucose/arabinose dehydrogenase